MNVCRGGRSAVHSSLAHCICSFQHVVNLDLSIHVKSPHSTYNPTAGHSRDRWVVGPRWPAVLAGSVSSRLVRGLAQQTGWRMIPERKQLLLTSAFDTHTPAHRESDTH